MSWWRQGEKLSWSSINAVSIADDGSVLLSGYTSDSLNSTLDLDTAAGDDENYDFAVVKLDVNGTELWVYQVGSESVTCRVLFRCVDVQVAYDHLYSNRAREDYVRNAGHVKLRMIIE